MGRQTGFTAFGSDRGDNYGGAEPVSHLVLQNQNRTDIGGRLRLLDLSDRMIQFLWWITRGSISCAAGGSMPDSALKQLCIFGTWL